MTRFLHYRNANKGKIGAAKFFVVFEFFPTLSRFGGTLSL